MKKYELTQTDYEQMNSLIKIMSLIDDLYLKLYDLEISDQKNTAQYKKIVDYLNALVEKENKKYKEYNLTQARSLAWIDYLITNKIPTTSKFNIETIIQQDYSNRIIKRILNRLISNVDSCELEDKDLFYDVKKELESEGLNLPNELITHSITSSVRIKNSLECDIFNLYLSFLGESINNDKLKSIKKQLINSKYNFSFINKNIEISMIPNKFEIDTTLYISSKVIAELQYISPSLYTFLKDSYGIKILLEQIIELLKIEDIDYNNPKKIITSILRQNLIKSILLTLSDETIKDVKREYKNIIEKDFYTLSPLSNDMSKGLVNYCFESVKKEKNKLNVLSLKKNN